MNFLKIKLGVFSLLAVLAVSVFLSSCEQSEIVSSNINQYSTQQEMNSGDTKYVLPKGIEENEENLLTYLDNINEETSLKLVENFRIASFLAEENIFDVVWEDMSYGEHLSDINLVNCLTESQLTALRHYSSNLNSRSKTCYTVSCEVVSQYNGSWCNYTCYVGCFDENGSFLHILYDYSYMGRC